MYFAISALNSLSNEILVGNGFTISLLTYASNPSLLPLPALYFLCSFYKIRIYSEVAGTSDILTIYFSFALRNFFEDRFTATLANPHRR